MKTESSSDRLARYLTTSAVNVCIALLLSFVLISCSKSGDQSDNSTIHSVNAHNNTAEEQKRVLIIFSYTYNYPSFEGQMSGIRAVFDSAGINYDVEFMDAKRFNTQENSRTKRERLSYKMNLLPPYDAILTCDEDALYFALENQDSLFRNIPIVFCSVNDVKFAQEQDSNPMVTGISETVSMKETIVLMHHLFPQGNEVYAISDVTTQGKSDLRDYLDLQGKMPDLNLKYLSLQDYSYEELAGKLSEIRATTPVLCLACYRDKNGSTMPFDESVEYLKKYVKSPLFHLWEQGIDTPGMVGGKVMTFFNQGHYAASVVNDVFNGKDIASIKVNIKGDNAYLFNYNELKRFNIERSKLPEGSTVLYKPISIFVKYRYPIIFFSTIIFFLTLLIIARYFTVSKKKEAIRQLLEARNELQEKKMIIENTNMFLNNIIDQIPIGIYIKDPEKNFEYVVVNSAVNKITRQDNIFINHNDKEIFDPYLAQNFLEEDLVALKDVNMPKVYQKRLDFSGDSLIVKIKKISFKTPDGHAWVIGTVEDITNEEKAKDDLKMAKKKAEESDRLKSLFLANMSHEIRTPLNSIIGFAGLLSEDNVLSVDKKKYSEIINANCSLLLKLINDILDLSVIEVKSLKFNRSEFDFSEFFDRHLFSLKPRITSPDVELIIDNPYKKCIVNLDEYRTAQCITNLVINAIKYTMKGHIKVGYEYIDGGIRLYVEDTGVGIDAAHLNKVFDRFEKIDYFAQGVGLGLSITKALVEYDGGRIWVDSIRGKGSTFWIWKKTEAEIDK